MAEGTKPWQVDSSKSESGEHFKYQYHPGGDKKKELKKAPGALSVVIVPNVTLTKVGGLNCEAAGEALEIRARHAEPVRP